jgi:hypothetical protein
MRLCCACCCWVREHVAERGHSPTAADVFGLCVIYVVLAGIILTAGGVATLALQTMIVSGTGMLNFGLRVPWGCSVMTAAVVAVS